MSDQPVYIVTCKLVGVYTDRVKALQARDLILQFPDKYLTVTPWMPQEYEFPFIQFQDDRLEEELLTGS